MAVTAAMCALMVGILGAPNPGGDSPLPSLARPAGRAIGVVGGAVSNAVAQVVDAANAAVQPLMALATGRGFDVVPGRDGPSDTPALYAGASSSDRGERPPTDGTLSAATLPAGAINPALVSTVAGSGLNQTTNGTGAGASFRDMGGIAVTGTSVYLATVGSIRKVDTTTGAVTTVAGDPTATGCVVSTTATAVRFSTFWSLTSDGTYLYSVGACGLRRTRISTGATEAWASTISSPRQVAVAGTNLYVTSGTTLYKVTNKGVASPFAALAGAGEAVAYDSSTSSIWVAFQNWTTYSEGFQKISLSGVVSPPLFVTPDNFSIAALTAIGGTLYGPGRGWDLGGPLHPVLRAYNSTDGSAVEIAGNEASGYQDGTSSEAWFGNVAALANDGTRLFIADNTNFRLRRAVAGTPLPGAQPGSVSTTVALNPANVSTAAGNGTKANVDGSATAASFTETRGVTIAGAYAYVGSGSAIRRIHMATGAVSTLAGSLTVRGYVNASDPTAVRFDQIIDLATDGTYVYSTDGGAIRRTSIATGATSKVTNAPGPRIAYGPGRFLYTLWTSGEPGNPALAVYKLDPLTGAWTALYEAPTLGRGLATDASSVWITRGGELVRIDATTGAAATVASNIGSPTTLTSAGNYLYASYGTHLRRIDKATGAQLDVAGAGAGGYVFNLPMANGFGDGTSTEAWFSSLDALVSDGTALWAADTGNARVRKFVAGIPLPAAQAPSANTTLALDLGNASTFAGNGTAAEQDGLGVTASFAGPVASVAVGGFTYVGTTYGIRKVDTRSGEVTTLAGSKTETGFVDSSNPSLVRFYGIGDLTTDGTYLYSLSYGPYSVPTVRRTSLATGATSTIYNDYDLTGLTYGPGNVLYVVKNQPYVTWYSDAYSSIFRLDPLTGQKTDLVPQEINVNTYGITSDATSVWAVRSLGGQTYSPRRLVRIDPSNGATTIVADATYNEQGMITNVVGSGSIVSTGDYIYNAVPDSNNEQSSIRRFSKATGAHVDIAGGATRGYADGIGAVAKFDRIGQLASDGVSLWVADWGNSRLRRVVAAPVGGAPTVTENPTGSNMCSPCVSDVLNEDLSTVTDYPINVQYGNFFHTFDDLSIPGRGFAIDLSRTYNSDSAFSSVDGIFGHGWSSSYSMRLEAGADQVVVHQEDGAQVRFDRSGSSWVPRLPRTIATLTRNGDSTWTFVRHASQTVRFDSSGRLTALQDRNGYVTTVAYPSIASRVITDPSGRTLTLGLAAGHVVSASDSAGRSLTYGYDGSGNLTDIIDVGGGHWTFTYDGAHRMLTMRSPRFFGDTTTTPSPVVTNHYDNQGRIDWQSDPVGRTTSFDYVSIPGSTKITDPGGKVTVNTYSNGMLASVTKGYGVAGASTWRFTYDPTTAVPSQVIDPNGRSAFMYADARGNVTATVDALGRTTRRTFNGFGQVLTATDAAGTTTTNVYDPSGNLLSTSTPLVGTTQVQTTTYNYGGTTPVYAGDVTSVVDPRGKTWAYRYDAFGNLVRTVAPPTPENPAGNTTTFAYDTARGWLTSSVSPRGNIVGANGADYRTIYEHDAYGRVTATKDPLWSAGTPSAHRRLAHYDADGNLDSSTDGSDNTTTYLHDAAGQLLTVTRPDSSTLRNDYWPDGSLKTQYDGANRATAYTYDVQGRMASMTDPAGRVTAYGYDLVGNLLTQQQPGGNCASSPKVSCITRGYDAGNRLLAVTYSDGTTPNVTSVTYDPAGRRSSQSAGGVTSTWSWDSLGRLTSATDANGATLGYTWDLGGHATSITYPGGTRTITRAYDDAGRWASVTDWSSRTTAFGYDPDSNLVSTTYPNGTAVANVVDRAGAGMSTQLSGPAGVLASLSYTRNGSGQLDSQAGAGLGQATASYGYNGLRQLTNVDGVVAFAHDASDNLTRLRGTTQAFDVSNQLTSSTPDEGSPTSYGFDGRGNRTSVTPPGGATTTLSYDQADRLKSWGNTATYVYDGDGRRRSKTVGGSTTVFTWDGSGGLPVIVQAGAASFVHGPGGLPIEQIEGDGTTRWLFHDHLGSTRAITNAAGGVEGTWTYDPYGKVVASSGTATTPFGFTGQWTDTESGFVHLRARYFDPATGQFLTRDPLVSGTRSAYGYVDGDPLTSTDPTGLYKYTYDHKLGRESRVGSPEEVMEYFKQHPSEVFPFDVEGCPMFVDGAVCTLHAGPKWAKGVGRVAVTTSATSVTFTVCEGNDYFDRAGSTITFSTYAKKGNVYLRQGARAVSANPVLDRAAPKLAKFTWEEQAKLLSYGVGGSYREPTDWIDWLSGAFG